VLIRKGQIEIAHPIDGEGVVQNDKSNGSKKELVPLATAHSPGPVDRQVV
jgi:hypothetical protein